MPKRRVLLSSLTAALVLAAPTAAAAQETVPPSAAPAPAKTTVKLAFNGLVQRQVLGGESWSIKGTVSSYVAGQSIDLTITRRGRKIVNRRLSIRDKGGVGHFTLPLKLSGAGRLTIRASHVATAEMAATQSLASHVTVVARYAARGSRGLAVKYLQRRLSKLGYVVGRRGYYDARTGRAVLAFRKVTRMARTYTASAELFRRLARGEGRFKVRYKNHGRHVEIDLRHQVLALINRGKAVRIYPTSSGKPSTPTILGKYRVYRKDPGTNALGMIYSSYFIRGYAIHGFVDVPIYPASHGCLRLPPSEAISVYNWIRIGTRVDSYYR